MQKRKSIEFLELDKPIQKYADEHCEGNFNRAVRDVIRKNKDISNILKINRTGEKI